MKKINFFKISGLLALFALVAMPVISFAQTIVKCDSLQGCADGVTNILADSVIKLIFALAFVFFMWGVIQYLMFPDDEKKKDAAKSFMVWGIIALTVMFSVYGLIYILQGTFGLGDINSSDLNQPTFPTN